MRLISVSELAQAASHISLDLSIAMLLQQTLQFPALKIPAPWCSYAIVLIAHFGCF